MNDTCNSFLCKYLIYTNRKCSSMSYVINILTNFDVYLSFFLSLYLLNLSSECSLKPKVSQGHFGKVKVIESLYKVPCFNSFWIGNDHVTQRDRQMARKATLLINKALGLNSISTDFDHCLSWPLCSVFIVHLWLWEHLSVLLILCFKEMPASSYNYDSGRQCFFFFSFSYILFLYSEQDICACYF
jgi:hypothetical protein